MIPIPALTPAGGTLPNLSLNFSNTETLDPRITFSRASNATVTNSAGNIAYAPMNLLTFSEQFDNSTWTKAGTTISANASVSPNGETTADKIAEDSTTGSHSVTQGVPNLNVQNCYSWFAKAAERTKVVFTGGGFTAQGFTATFNLSNGTMDSNVGSRAAITAVGNGWYRCSVTFTPSNTTAYSILIADASGNTTYTGTTGSGVLIWGAQLEIGATATTYNSTTVKNLLGFSESFDNAAWTKSNSFVQTNLLTYSEDFTVAGWTKGNSSISANAVLAPNGYQTADKLIENTATSTHQIAQAYSSSSGKYVFSAYLKAAERTTAYIQLSDGATGSVYAIADLTAGTVTKTATGSWTNTDVSITSVGNGWYRISAFGTQGAGVTMFLAIALGSNTSGYTGDGTSGIYIWGAQLVQGSVAGDYRRTDAASLPIFYPNHNGVVCAEKLVENTATTTNHRIDSGNPVAIVGTTYTNSFYVKAGERTWCILYDQGAAAGRYFDLENGVLGNTFVAAPLNSSITPVGNGWYRISITCATGLTVEGCRLYITTGNGVSAYTGDGTSGIYIFGAQLSDSASLDPYVLNAGAAPSSLAYYGPRFDYDPVTKQPKGLLIEEQRSNLLLYSEQFNDATWQKSNVTVTANATTSPDGTVDADLFLPTGTPAQLFQAVTKAASAITYTFSFYVKAFGFTTLRAFIYGATNANRGDATFELSNGTVSAVLSVGAFTSTSATITLVNNGFYKCTVTTTSDTTTAIAVNLRFDGTPNGTSGFYIWGAQLEAGAFATSYIPTVASSVTRSADIATIAGSNFYSWYNQNEGSVVVNADETSTAVSGNRKTLYTLTTGNFNNIIRNGIESGTSSGFTTTYESAAQAALSISASYQANVFSKSSTAYKVNDFYLNVNNGTATVDTLGTTPIAFFMDIGYGPQVGSGTANTAGDFLNGHIKSLSYYPQRLSDSVLKGLTA